MPNNRKAFYAGWDAAMQHNGQETAEEHELTEREIAAACMNYRHDFGLMSVAEQDEIRFQATEWDIALQKARRE
jgi:hypothetical protein